MTKATRIGETVFDRVGDKLIKSAANLLLISNQIAISEKRARGVVQSQKEIEAVNTEALEQIEQRASEIEQAVTAQLNAVRALQEGQVAQEENRAMIEALASDLVSSGIPEVLDDVRCLATILGHANYLHLVKGEMPLWAWLLRIVDVPVFVESFGLQEKERQRALFNGLRETVNELKKVDGLEILAEPE
jgi:hypothetical protein